MPRRLLGPCLLLLALPGCFGAVPPQQKHFYHLRDAGPPREAAAGARVAVRTFTALPGYDSLQLAYRVSPRELRYYEHRKWVAEPARMLAEMTIRHLRAAGLFAEVDVTDKVREPRVVVEATVDAIEEVDLKEGWEARLAMTIVVRQGERERVRFRHVFDERQRCSRRDVDAVIDALSEILARQLQQLARRVAALPVPGT